MLIPKILQNVSPSCCPYDKGQILVKVVRRYLFLVTSEYSRLIYHSLNVLCSILVTLRYLEFSRGATGLRIR